MNGESCGQGAVINREQVEAVSFHVTRKVLPEEKNRVPAAAELSGSSAAVCAEMVPRHVVRILHCKDGSIKLAHGPQFLLMHEASFAVISPEYTYTLIGQGELYVLDIHENLFAKCCELAGLNIGRLGRGMEYEENGRIRYITSGWSGDWRKVRQLLDSLTEEAYLGLPGYQQMMQGIIMQLAVIVRREYGESEQDSLNPEAGQIRNYIFRNCRNVTAADTAETFHYHVNTINRILKKAYGQTFTQILHQCRLQLASQLLCSSSLSVRDVSVECGYDNLSYFYRIFQETFHMTPSQWRRHSVGIREQ